MVADIAKLTVGREEYYTRELATDHEQYLSGHGESPGRWYGAGASRLGLQGEASVAGFQAMFEGRDPTTGEAARPPPVARYQQAHQRHRTGGRSAADFPTDWRGAG